MAVEMNHEQMLDAQRLNERDFMRRGCEKMRRILGSQDLGRVRIEGHDDRRTVRGLGVSR